MSLPAKAPENSPNILKKCRRNISPTRQRRFSTISFAYIGAAENKTAPKLVIFSKELQAPVTIAGKTSWNSIHITDPPGKNLMALAVFPAADGNKNYTVFRAGAKIQRLIHARPPHS